MADAAQQKARRDLRRAHANYERKQGQLQEAREARRESFEQAQKAGLSLRDIASEIDLHWTRVGEVLREK